VKKPKTPSIIGLKRMGQPLEKEQVIEKINTGFDKNKKRILKILGKEIKKTEKVVTNNYADHFTFLNMSTSEMNKVVDS
jgi:hypothetical protein